MGTFTSQQLTRGTWKAAKVNTHGKETYEIHYSEDGECVAEVVHSEADAVVMARSKEMLELLQYFVQENMLSIAGDEMAKELISKALLVINQP